MKVMEGDNDGSLAWRRSVANRLSAACIRRMNGSFTA